MFYGDQGFKYPTWNKIYCWVMIIVLDSDAKVRIFNSSQKMRDIFWSSGLNILSGPLARLSWSRAPELSFLHQRQQISGKLGGSWHQGMMSMDKSVGIRASVPHIYLS